MLKLSKFILIFKMIFHSQSVNSDEPTKNSNDS